MQSKAENCYQGQKPLCNHVLSQMNEGGTIKSYAERNRLNVNQLYKARSDLTCEFVTGGFFGGYNAYVINLRAVYFRQSEIMGNICSMEDLCRYEQFRLAVVKLWDSGLKINYHNSFPHTLTDPTYSGKSLFVPLDVAQEDIMSFWTQVANMRIDLWRSRYDDPYVTDGTQWSLKLCGRKYSGSNSWPEGFNSFDALVHQLTHRTSSG